MSIQAINWAYHQTVGRTTAKFVLVALADQANQNGKCWPSVEYISQRCEITERAVMQNIKFLIDNGFIERFRRGGEGEGRKTNIYVLQLGNVNDIHDGQRERNDKQRERNDKQRERGSPKSTNNHKSISNTGRKSKSNGKKLYLPKDENLLPMIARKHGLPESKPGEKTEAYWARLMEIVHGDAP